MSAESTAGPLWLLAELTYRCPLHCVFCSNPLDYVQHRDELTTDDWLRVLHEARALGAVQLGFSGGEPLLRDDLEVLVQEAHRIGYYTNLITSGIGLTEARAAALKAAGLDHIQLSFQDSTRELNDFLSSTRTFDLKSKVAGTIKRQGYPMVLNCVLHRYNLPHVGRIIEMAEAMGADVLELANTQYYGWAWRNRAALMPAREALAAAEREVERQRARLGRRLKILWVSPDYADAKPKACMAGWGSVFMVVAPDGLALPCHSARMLPGLEFPNVRSEGVAEIWRESAAFNRYRGTAWMNDTCRSCDRHGSDHAGCRCQAYLVTGDAQATDPVCPDSPHRPLIDAMLDQAADPVVHPIKFMRRAGQDSGLHFRNDENSRRFATGEIS
ncbi:MAG TPA: pyrroloquinoline quinone biosynthesis protein PqqE [Albitalea sp.]|uniref:pyrroloquinoline quinone biosynthesis protein PqqE n=1 Tax=Piscinibacter sp. TaxID=1903157 RepID=UPI002ED5172D